MLILPESPLYSMESQIQFTFFVLFKVALVCMLAYASQHQQYLEMTMLNGMVEECRSLECDLLTRPFFLRGAAPPRALLSEKE